MYKYTEQATIQEAMPGLLRGPANVPNNRAQPADLRGRESRNMITNTIPNS
jgi:hypothetical protein